MTETSALQPRREITEIRPSRGLFDLELNEIWKRRELLYVLTMRDIQVLYRQAAIGIAWAVVQPVFAVLIFTVIFGLFARLPTDGAPYAVFAFAGVLPWTYFAEAMRRASACLVNEGDLVKKVYFPRLMLPLVSVTAPLLDFFIALVVFLGLMLLHGIFPTWRIIAVVPLIGFAALIALAVGLWLGPLNVRFRDVKHTLPFLTQIWMYASPVIYPLSLIPEEWRWAYSLNPMVGVIEGFRWATIGGGGGNLEAMAIGALVTAVLLVLGLMFFRKSEASFADLI